MGRDIMGVVLGWYSSLIKDIDRKGPEVRAAEIEAPVVEGVKEL